MITPLYIQDDIPRFIYDKKPGFRYGRTGDTIAEVMTDAHSSLGSGHLCSVMERDGLVAWHWPAHYLLDGPRKIGEFVT